MNELASLGLILLFALAAGHAAKFVRVPEVTGYILAGVAVGPYGLNWLTHDNLTSLAVFSEVALGLILFSIGSVFELAQFRGFGRTALLVTVVDAALVAIAVGGGMLLLGQPWPLALLLGAIAIETAAASTLMVIRECNAEGPLTELLVGTIALNNLVCIAAFSVVATAVDLHAHAGSQSGGMLEVAYRSIYPLVWQFVGSICLGYLVGLLLAGWAARVTERGEVLILMAGSVLLCVGVSQVLDLSPLIASLAVGATMVNLSGKSRDLFHALAHTDPPLYAIFFVLGGADLNVGLLPSLGVTGAVYVAGRIAAKFASTAVVTRALVLEPRIRRWMGFSMLAQAGLAIGLVMLVGRRFPELAPAVTAVVMSSVIVFELIGPVSVRLALTRSGEVRTREDSAAMV
jgi:Kef-type K+ transport system membrane component KefB